MDIDDALFQDGNIAEDGTLVPDFKSQDYVLDRDGVDNGTHYLFRISRLLETCDDEDYPITVRIVIVRFPVCHFSKLWKKQ